METKFAVARTVGLAIALLCAGTTIPVALSAIEAHARFRRWLTDRPMELSVDLSRHGETTAPFHQTCGISHGESLYLAISPRLRPGEKVADLFEGLSAVLIVLDKENREKTTVDINAKELSDQNRDRSSDDLHLASFPPFAEGEYTAILRVVSPADRLADRQQKLYAKYMVCGMELFPAYFLWMFAFGFGLVAFVALACVLPGLLRNGFRNPVVKKSG